MTDVGSPVLWSGFIALVIFLLALDLGVLQRRVTQIGLKQAAIWSAIWIALALAFNYWVYHSFGSEKALQFLNGYVMEKALSVDNLFVFLVIFRYFAVPPRCNGGCWPGASWAPCSCARSASGSGRPCSRSSSG